MKNKSGEVYCDEYLTTFGVLHPTDNPNILRVKPAKIKTTKSESRFYNLIFLLEKEEKILPLTRLSAEYSCFTQGFKRIDSGRKETVGKTKS